MVQKALDAGIKVVAKDIDLGNPKVPLISQNDHEIARQVLDQALQENGTSFPAGYVFVAGFRPLELRGEQEELNKNDIKTVSDLDSKLPGFGSSDQAVAAWIPIDQQK